MIGTFTFGAQLPGLESPTSKRADGGIVQNRISDALRHARVGHVAAGRINASKRKHRCRLLDELRASYGYSGFGAKIATAFAPEIDIGSSQALRRFDWTAYGLLVLWRRRLFLRETPAATSGIGGGCWHRNIFRRRSWLVFRLQASLRQSAVGICDRSMAGGSCLIAAITTDAAR